MVSEDDVWSVLCCCGGVIKYVLLTTEYSEASLMFRITYIASQPLSASFPTHLMSRFTWCDYNEVRYWLTAVFGPVNQFIVVPGSQHRLEPASQATQATGLAGAGAEAGRRNNKTCSDSSSGGEDRQGDQRRGQTLQSPWSLSSSSPSSWSPLSTCQLPLFPTQTTPPPQFVQFVQFV